MKRIIIALTLLMLTMPIQAIPFPHAISGNIYLPDGTKAQTTEIIITNTQNEQVRQGTATGGDYSAAINGLNGDILEIRAKSENYSTMRLVSLEGVMHNVDIYLGTGANTASTPSIGDQTEEDQFAVAGIIFDRFGNPIQTTLTVRNGRTTRVNEFQTIDQIPGHFYSIIPARRGDILIITTEYDGRTVEMMTTIEQDLKDQRWFIEDDMITIEEPNMIERLIGITRRLWD